MVRCASSHVIGSVVVQCSRGASTKGHCAGWLCVLVWVMAHHGFARPLPATGSSFIRCHGSPAWRVCHGSLRNTCRTWDIRKAACAHSCAREYERGQLITDPIMLEPRGRPASATISQVENRSDRTECAVPVQVQIVKAAHVGTLVTTIGQKERCTAVPPHSALSRNKLSCNKTGRRTDALYCSAQKNRRDYARSAGRLSRHAPCDEMRIGIPFQGGVIEGKVGRSLARHEVNAPSQTALSVPVVVATMLRWIDRKQHGTAG